jgi:catechol 2,3-dioxygenase
VRIGQVDLKVADLERALGLYCGVLGFELTVRRGRASAFLAAGGYHHHIGLNTWESLGAARARYDRTLPLGNSLPHPRRAMLLLPVSGTRLKVLILESVVGAAPRRLVILGF